MMIDKFKPSPATRAWYVTAEYQGRRYFITSAQDVATAERVALDYVEAYPDARFFTDDCWSKSVSIDGVARDLRSSYHG